MKPSASASESTSGEASPPIASSTNRWLSVAWCPRRALVASAWAPASAREISLSEENMTDAARVSRSESAPATAISIDQSSRPPMWHAPISEPIGTSWRARLRAVLATLSRVARSTPQPSRSARTIPASSSPMSARSSSYGTALS